MILQRLTSTCLATLLIASLATAQTPFAGEDFDGGATNGGLTGPTSSLFTPDNSGSTPRGTFNSGSIFDRFGEVSTADNLPFGVVDESLVGFPGDTSGFVPEGKTDDFVLGVDLENGNNPGGTAMAEWTFDITGRTNLQLSMDMGMLGDFEDTDVYEFVYSIDDSAPALAFRVEGLSGEFYSYTMDDGTFIDRFTSNFFDDTEWQDIIDNGETPGIFEYHIRDDGTNGDTTAQDGLVPVTFADGTEEVRGYRVTNSNGTFDQEEFAPVKDPLGITSGDGLLSQEQLIADFATYSTALVGTGSELKLTLNAAANSGDEYFAFDNIVLSEVEDTMGLAADFNGDGVVDLADLDILGTNFGADPATQAQGDATGDGVVDLADLDVLGNQFGMMAPAALAVPEPTAVAIAALAFGALAGRRQG